MRNRTVLSSVPWGAAALAAIAQLFACSEQSPADPVRLGEGGVAAEGGGAAETQLTAVSLEAEVQDAFNNAACACEANLINPAGASGDFNPEWASNVSADVCSGDPRLASYVAAYPLGSRQGGTCFNAATSPVVPLRRTAAADESVTNGCFNPVAQDTTGQTPSAGFCRADFNYCVGQQLRLKADSFAHPPSTPEAKAKVLEEARHRFEMSASEFASTLERVDVTDGAACTGPQVCVERSGQQSGSTTSSIKVTEVCQMECAQNPGVGEARAPAKAAGGGEERLPGEDNFCQPGTCCLVRVCRPSPTLQGAQATCASLANTKRSQLLGQTPDAFDNLVSATGTLSPNSSLPVGGTYTCTVNFSFPTFRTDTATREQQRVRDGYGDKAALRLADAVSQVADLADAELSERTASSDALSVVGATFLSDLWGPAGQRALAARSLFGDRAPRAGSQPPLPRQLQKDDRPRRMLELLEAHDVPLPYQLCAPNQGWEALTAAAADAWKAQAFDALAQGFAAKLGRAATEGPTLLRSEHAVGPEHVLPALNLARDRVEQLDLDYSFAPPEGSPPGTCGRGAIRLHSRVARQREPVALASSFADGAFANPSGCQLTGPRPSTKALSGAGAAGALDYLRTRTNALAGRAKIREWKSAEGVKAAQSEVNHFVGGRRSAFSRAGATTSWSVASDVTTPPSADDVAALPNAVVVARSEDELSCLRRGHKPGTPPDAPGATCAPAEFTLGAPSTVDGVTTRSFSMSNASFGASDRAFIASKACEGAACAYELLDVIYPQDAQGAHAIGGKLLDDLARLYAHDTTNPAQAAFNSLGVESGFVPPLQNAVDSSGQTLEAHVRYLRDAKEAAAAAAVDLAAARDLEFSVLVSRTAEILAEEGAELAQREVLSAACGNASPTCAVQRAEPKTLLELGLVPDAGADPGGFGIYSTCPQFLTHATFDLPDEGTKDYVAGFVGASLRCTRWATLLLAGATTLEGLPQRVVDELANESAPGTFGEAGDPGGEQQRLFIELYQQLKEVRVKTRAFETTYRVADTRLQAAVVLLEDIDPSFFDKMTCVVSHAGMILKSTVGTYGAIVALSAATGGAGAPAALAAMGALGSGLTSVGNGLNSLKALGECTDDDDGTHAAALNAWASALEAMEAMRGLSDESARLVGAAALAGNRLDKTEADAALAAERAELEKRVAANQLHNDPSWRGLQGFRVEEARRKLRDAQKLAFAARRAIEFRTASELRWLTDAGYVGGAPASWSNGLFTVGQAYLGTGGSAQAVGVAGERIVAYADALENFIEQYPVRHAFTSGTDRAVVSLRGVTGAQGALTDKLLFKCKAHPDLLIGGRLPGAPSSTPPCSLHGGVDFARAAFAVPSAVSGYFADAQVFATGNKNYRIDRTAINLQAAAFIDCDRPGSLPDCVTNQTVRYDLVQDGIVALESLDGEHRHYGLRDWRVEDGRALANETVLSSPPDADDQAIVQYERTELQGRPLGGVYTLTLKSRPELVWQNLTDVQVLIHYEYWTSQL